jgi:hypothetical protein
MLRNNRNLIGVCTLSCWVAFAPFFTQAHYVLVVMFFMAVSIRVIKPVEAWMKSYTIYDWFNPKPKLTMTPVTNANIDVAMRQWLSKYKYITEFGMYIDYGKSLGLVRPFEVFGEEFIKLLNSMRSMLSSTVGMVVCVFYFMYVCVRLPIRFMYWMLFDNICKAVASDVKLSRSLIWPKDSIWPKADVCEIWHVDYVSHRTGRVFLSSEIKANSDYQALELAKADLKKWWNNRTGIEFPNIGYTIEGQRITINVED